MFVISEPAGRTMPSTTYKGSTPPSIEPAPRIITCGELPGCPLLIICTPATFPCIACVAVNTGCFTNSLPFTVAVAPVTSIFLCVPYPTTTTWSNGFSDCIILMLSTD